MSFSNNINSIAIDFEISGFYTLIDSLGYFVNLDDTVDEALYNVPFCSKFEARVYN